MNKFKNRLVNILPFESSRVCLQPLRSKMMTKMMMMMRSMMITKRPFLFFVSKLLTSIAVKKRLINKQRTYTGASREAIISTPALLMVTDIGTPISLLRFITTLIIIKINMFV